MRACRLQANRRQIKELIAANALPHYSLNFDPTFDLITILTRVAERLKIALELRSVELGKTTALGYPDFTAVYLLDVCNRRGTLEE